jgi:hypothetical protein
MSQPKQETTANSPDAATQDRPLIHRLRSERNPSSSSSSSSSVSDELVDFREREGREKRKAQLRELWHQLPTLLAQQRQQASGKDDRKPSGLSLTQDGETLTRDDARRMREAYVRELLGSCSTKPGQSSNTPDNIGWDEFKEYALKKEEGALYC